MSWLLILVIAVMGITTFVGYKKGLIKMVLSLLSIVITLAAVCIVTPIISDFVKNNTGAYNKLHDAVEEKLFTEEMFSGSESEIIKKIEVPEAVRELLEKNNSLEKYKEMGVATFKEYVTRSVTDLIFNAIIFVVSYIIVFIAVRILFAAINLISKLPLINQANKFAGLVIGFAEGLLIVWLLFAAATMLGSTDFGKSVFEQVNGNALLGFLYKNNLVMKYLLSIM